MAYFLEHVYSKDSWVNGVRSYNYIYISPIFMRFLPRHIPLPTYHMDDRCGQIHIKICHLIMLMSFYDTTIMHVGIRTGTFAVNLTERW